MGGDRGFDLLGIRTGQPWHGFDQYLSAAPRYRRAYLRNCRKDLARRSLLYQSARRESQRRRDVAHFSAPLRVSGSNALPFAMYCAARSTRFFFPPERTTRITIPIARMRTAAPIPAAKKVDSTGHENSCLKRPATSSAEVNSGPSPLGTRRAFEQNVVDLGDDYPGDCQRRSGEQANFITGVCPSSLPPFLSAVPIHLAAK